MQSKEKVNIVKSIDLNQDPRFDNIDNVKTVSSFRLKDIGDGKFISFDVAIKNDNYKISDFGILTTYDIYGNVIDDSSRYYESDILPSIQSYYTEPTKEYVGITIWYNYDTVITIGHSVNGDRYILLYFIAIGDANNGSDTNLFELKVKIGDDYMHEFISCTLIEKQGANLPSSLNDFYKTYDYVHTIDNWSIINSVKYDDPTLSFVFRNIDTCENLWLLDIISQDNIDKIQSISYSIEADLSVDYNIISRPGSINNLNPCFVRDDGIIVLNRAWYLEPKDGSTSRFKLPFFLTVDLKNKTMWYMYDETLRFYDSNHYSNYSTLDLNGNYFAYVENDDFITLNMSTLERNVIDTKTKLISPLFDTIKGYLEQYREPLTIPGDYVIVERYVSLEDLFSIKILYDYKRDMWHGYLVFKYIDEDSSLSIPYIFIEITLSVPDCDIYTIDSILCFEAVHEYATINTITTIGKDTFAQAKWTVVEPFCSGSIISFGRYRYVGDYLLNDDILLKNIKEACQEQDNIHYGEPIYNVVDDGLYENK